MTKETLIGHNIAGILLFKQHPTKFYSLQNQIWMLRTHMSHMLYHQDPHMHLSFLLPILSNQAQPRALE